MQMDVARRVPLGAGASGRIEMRGAALESAVGSAIRLEPLAAHVESRVKIAVNEDVASCVRAVPQSPDRVVTELSAAPMRLAAPAVGSPLPLARSPRELAPPLVARPLLPHNLIQLVTAVMVLLRGHELRRPDGRWGAVSPRDSRRCLPYPLGRAPRHEFRVPQKEIYGLLALDVDRGLEKTLQHPIGRCTEAVALVHPCAAEAIA